jgi:FMN-dependent NADH-azoreductase
MTRIPGSPFLGVAVVPVIMGVPAPDSGSPGHRAEPSVEGVAGIHAPVLPGGAGTPRQGWDHSTGYLRRILHDVWGADLTVVEREFTLVGVNPALDDFKDLAAEMHQGALASAREAGKVLAAARAG